MKIKIKLFEADMYSMTFFKYSFYITSQIQTISEEVSTSVLVSELLHTIAT